ncbi:MAG: TIGR03087 family PEP-CTERM/XrtA system glycosyltransferase, partial [Gammaproteobacteria bacterium]|nr:TIGR03087 family PEP-CTERM/XrtA system glycosyltransferase [Gammaproteobacteria bacterium]
EKRCASICVRKAGTSRRIRAGIHALATRQSITLSHYRDRKMSRWVSSIGKQKTLAAVLVISSGMASYLDLLPAGVPRVLDMVDVDSQKWAEYATDEIALRRWLYQREARLLAAEELAISNQVSQTILISDDEAELLKSRGVQRPASIHVIANGVDSDYFSADSRPENPYPPAEIPLVFTGAMDYHANIEGICWFAEAVFPDLYQANRQLRLYIVGSSPAAEVRALNDAPGINVVGRVPDVRPYLAHSRLALAPLRIARGLQNKILEAMSMNIAVVATSAAMRGIDFRGPGVHIADTAAEFQQAVLGALDETSVLANRRFVKQHFSWDAALEQLEGVLTSA